MIHENSGVRCARATGRKRRVCGNREMAWLVKDMSAELEAWGHLAGVEKSWREVNHRSKGFPRTRITKRSCAVECGRGPVSVGAFFFLSFSHPESCLKIKIIVGKCDVLGWEERAAGPREEKRKKKKIKRRKKGKTEIFFLENERMKKCQNEKPQKMEKTRKIEKC